MKIQNNSIIDIPAVILCGGKGLRIKGKFPNIHKSLIPIHDIPILNRIIQIYSRQGVKKIILLLGYLDEQIIKNFTSDEIELFSYKQNGVLEIQYTNNFIGEVFIQFLNTGAETTTSGRILLAKKHLKKYPHFFLTYADGLSDILLDALFNVHLKKKSVVTISGVKPTLSFGVLNIEHEMVTSFQEKPQADFWINGGFMVMSKDIFNYIDDKNDLEKNTFNKLVVNHKLAVYRHPGFWRCVDTEKDYWELESLFRSKDTVM